jgi:RHS repeat-associated protein
MGCLRLHSEFLRYKPTVHVGAKMLLCKKGAKAQLKNLEKVRELSNQLGNVLVTVSDRKTPQYKTTGTAPNTVTTFSYFKASILSATDYYPFGMAMPGRQVSADKYRYGFNGKEKDKNINSLTAYDYGFRIYNPAIGKFLSVDPLTQSYPWYTPYQFAGNSPILNIDVDGLEEATTQPNTQSSEPNSTPSSGSTSVNQRVFESATNITITNLAYHDAVKLANNQIQANIKSYGRYVSTSVDEQTKDIASLRKSVDEYLTSQGKNMSIGEVAKFMETTEQYYNIIPSAAMLNSSVYEDVNKKLINAPVSWESSVYANNVLIHKWATESSAKTWEILKAGGDAALFISSSGVGSNVGNGPRGTFKSSTQQNIVDAQPLVFKTSQANGFYMRSASSMTNGVYKKTIQTLAYMGEDGAGSMLKVVRSIEAEAKAAGARSLEIHGIEIVNPNILKTAKATAGRFGYSFEQVTENSIKLAKQLK